MSLRLEAADRVVIRNRGNANQEIQGSLDLKTSWCDRFAGFLYSGLLFAAAWALVAFLIWWNLMVSPTLGRGAPTPIPSSMYSESSGMPGADVEEVAFSEFPDVAEPNLNDAIVELSVVPVEEGGAGFGDQRQKGIGIAGSGSSDGGGSEVRWSLGYRADNLSDYRALLVRHGIELAAVRNGSDASQLAYLSMNSGTVEIRDGRKDKRVFFQQVKHPFCAWDRVLLGEVGVTTGAKDAMLHFFPAETLKRMQALENAELEKADRKREEIRSVLFSIKDDADGGVQLDAIRFQ